LRAHFVLIAEVRLCLGDERLGVSSHTEGAVAGVVVDMTRDVVAGG